MLERREMLQNSLVAVASFFSSLASFLVGRKPEKGFYGDPEDLYVIEVSPVEEQKEARCNVFMMHVELRDELDNPLTVRIGLTQPAKLATQVYLDHWYAEGMELHGHIEFIQDNRDAGDIFQLKTANEDKACGEEITRFFQALSDLTERVDKPRFRRYNTTLAVNQLGLGIAVLKDTVREFAMHWTATQDLRMAIARERQYGTTNVPL